MEVLTLNTLNQAIIDNLPQIRSLPFDVIVHLPRSGTIPASLLATYLIKPFCSLDELCANIVWTRKAEYTDLTKILLVDDSVNQGIQMADAVARIKKERPDVKIKTLAVFDSCNEKSIYQPDMTLVKHGQREYLFPWFIWKTKKINKCAVDMDGVLCRDCRKEEDDDGQNYLNFIQSADQKFKTKFTIGTIVTGRLRKYRNQTEDWLGRHGVNYDELIMAPFKNKEERKKFGAANWKAEVYANLNKSLYIESSVKEACRIHELSRKPVWCIDDQTFYDHFTINR